MKNFFISTFIAFASLFVFTTCFAGQNYTWNPASGSSAKHIANLRTTCATPGTVFPTSADTLVFDGSCSNANCVLDTTFNLAKINVKSNYSGSITVSGSITLTFGEGVFLSGTFNGGSVAITFTESLRINGNSFTSTSGVLSVSGDFTYKGSTFAHNSGTVLFKKGAATTTVLSGTSNAGTTLTLYKAEFAATAANTQYTIRNITVQVVNEMKLSGGYQLFLNTNTSSTVEVQGNIISSNTASVGGGTVLLLVNGTGAQTINDNQGASISGKLPNLKINKSSGTLSLYGSIGMGGSTTLEYVAGTISAGTSRLLCYYNNTLYNHSSGSLILSKLDFIGSGGTQTVTGKIMVSDTFSTSGTGNSVIDGDTLELQGKMIWNNTSAGSGGSVTYKLTGSNAQTISGAASLPLYDVIISKTSGDVTLQKEVKISHNLKFVTGYIISDATNLLTIKHGATVSSVSASSFVKGPVKKIGNSTFTFPIGKGTNYNPLEITAPSNSTDAFTAEYFGSNQTNGTSKDSLTYLSSCEYWNLSRTTGSSNVKVTLYWNSNSCDIYVLSTLKVAHWDGGKWANLGGVTTSGNTTFGSIQTNSNQSAYGTFIIAKRSPLVYASAGDDRIICEGVETELGGSPSGSGGINPLAYTWSPSIGLSSSTTANPTADPSETTNYVLTVTDIDHSTALDTINIIVNPTPVVNAGIDTIACMDFESYLGGNPTAEYGIEPYSYIWENAEGDTIFDVSNPFIELDSTIQLFLQVSDSNGCLAQDSIEILMASPIEIHSIIDTALFLNESAVLDPSVTGGTGSLDYLWSPGRWLSDSTSQNPTVTPLSTTYYTFEVQDSIGCKKKIYPNVSFSPINLGELFDYAAFQSDSIITGDTSIAIGGVASRYIDENLRLQQGFRTIDTSIINLLRNNLEEIIEHIDLLEADTINPTLSGDTIRSGIYRITGSAYLDGDLMLMGNDSSFFVFDIDSDFILESFSQIISVGVNTDKVFFSVNGNVIVGDSVLLSGTFLSSKNIRASGFVGKPAMLSAELISIEKQGLILMALDNNGDFNKPNCIGEDELTSLKECPTWNGIGERIGIAVPKKDATIGFQSKGYVMVFRDEFEADLDINTEVTDNDYRWHEWSFMADPDKDGHLYKYFNYPGQDNYEVKDGVLSLKLRNGSPGNFGNPDCVFTCGQISTSESFYHGYFEIRAKLPRGEGVWPAFWTFAGGCPGDEDRPLQQDQREIDFFDGYWKKNALPMCQFINIHPCDGSGISDMPCFYDDVCNKSLNLADNWHIYACKWESDFVTYYVDNVPISHVDLSHTNTNQMGIRDISMNLILTNGATSPYITDAGFPSFKGTTGKTQNPNEDDFQIDYVRVWQKKNMLSDGYFTDATTLTKAAKFATDCEFFVNTSRFAPGTQYHWSIPYTSTVNSENHNLVFTEDPIDGGSKPHDEWRQAWKLKTMVAGTYEVDLVIDHIPMNLKPQSNKFFVTVTGAMDELEMDCEAIISNCTICPGDFAFLSISPIEPEMKFQWIKAGSPILGATESSYIALLAGSYKCEVTLNGCYRTTNIITVHSLSGSSYECTLRESDSIKTSIDSKVRAYPNPATNYLTLFLDDEILDNANVELINLMGVKVKDWNISYNDSKIYSLMLLNNLPSGLYFLRLNIGNTVKVLSVQLNN